MDPRLEEALRLQEEEARQKEQAAREKYARRCYVDAFSSDAGRVVLSDLRKQFYDVATYVPGDPYGTHVAEGSREVVLRILTIMAEEAEAPKEAQRDAEV